jgi:hypothetical protein
MIVIADVFEIDFLLDFKEFASFHQFLLLYSVDMLLFFPIFILL